MDSFEAKRIKQIQLGGIAKVLRSVIEKGKNSNGEPTWADLGGGRRVCTQPGNQLSSASRTQREYDLWRVNCLIPAIIAGFLQTSRVVEGALVTLRFSAEGAEGENREEADFLVLNIENSLMLPSGIRFLNRESDIGSAIWERSAGETITIQKTFSQHISIVSVY